MLASNSPRRRQLLALTGLDFTVRPADVDESLLPGEEPQPYVRRLAREKAEACRHGNGAARILAADTIVVDGAGVLGKPQDAGEAARMLERLRGRTHQVLSAITLLLPEDSRLDDLCTTRVPMRNYSDEELRRYVESGDPLDKAGAYAIQHEGFHPVENFDGCYASVMGLPLCHLARRLHQAGLASPAGIPAACQAALHYDCPVSTRILRGETAG